MQVPVLGVFFDLLVNTVAVLERAANERLGEQPHGGLLRGGRGQLDFFSPSGRAFVFRERGGLLRDPELIERLVQIAGRIQIVLKQELHGAFPRFTSSAHTAARMKYAG